MFINFFTANSCKKNMFWLFLTFLGVFFCSTPHQFQRHFPELRQNEVKSNPQTSQNVRKNLKNIFLQELAIKKFMNTIGVEYELHRTCLDHRKLAHISQTQFSKTGQFAMPLLQSKLGIWYEFWDFSVLRWTLTGSFSMIRWSWKKIKYVFNIYCSRKCDFRGLLLTSSK